jgi:5S rRNA maturation endonuclease (ribonuclease M5)
MQTLQAYLHSHVNVEEFYKSELDNYIPGQNVICPFHDDLNPSLSINIDALGEYYCHSGECDGRGTSFIGFYVKKHQVPFQHAMKEIYSKYVRPTVPIETALEWHRTLMATPIVQKWLLQERGLTVETIQYYKLGFDGARLTIPVENEFGMVINVRRYDITRKSEAKMISYAEGYGRSALFPINALNGPEVIVTEGELDTLLGRQCGLNCICSTGGAGYWNEEFSNYLEDHSVIVLLDNDQPGWDGSQRIAASLTSKARTLKIARYETPGIDLTDYIIRHQGTIEGLRAIVDSGQIIVTTPQVVQKKLFKEIKLQDAAHSLMRGVPIQFKAHVAGKDVQPYIVPKRVKLTCMTKPERKCSVCSGPEPYVTVLNIDLHDERTLGLTNCTEGQLHSHIKEWAKCNGRCNVRIDVLESVNMEELKLVAPIEEVSDDCEFKYVMRTALAQTYNLDANATYVFRGYIYPDPDTQHAVFLIVDHEYAADQLDRFILTEDRKNELRRIFPSGNSLTSIHNFLDDFYEYCAIGITKIYKRRALHQAVDLVFHSALGFNFNNESIKRGWLDVLVMGDTRTGKGYVTERLSRYFGVGEVASGENCTFAGLIGGVQQLGARKSWAVTWGFIPRNDRRLVIIDEASAVAGDTLSRMSRVRSEGVAEVFKIVTERTMARTRTIWNANPADGRGIREFEHGVESVLTMAERKEDIARFDYVIVIASDEVDSEVINAGRGIEVESRPELQQACRDLILWIWSRKPSQIQFTDEATHIILEASVALGKKYHHSIPLIQAENAREKIAKVAVAVAGRVFSTDDTGECIRVTAACASYAVGFLQYLYDSDAMAYDVYSALQFERSSLLSERELENLFASYKQRSNQWIGDLLEVPKISVKGIEASLDIDWQLAKDVRNKLVSLRAIRAEHSWWTKREPFIKWLRKTRIRAIKNPDWWKEVKGEDILRSPVV